MKENWTRVSLGELLSLERRPVKVEADKRYQEIGIYCFGGGIFHKQPRTGFEVGDKDLFLLREGDFILQVTFAWEGAVAVVSAAEEGMYASTRYPTFRVNESRCLPQFLLQYFKTEEGLQQLVNICPGSAGRNRVLSIKRIPEVLVPLPSLVEQRGIVARIEELAGKIEVAVRLREECAAEAEALIVSARHSFFGETPTNDWVPLKRFVSEIENGKSPQCEPRPAREEEWGVLKVGAVSFGSFDERENKALPLGVKFDPRYEVRAGDFLMSRANTTRLVGACAIVGRTRPKLLLSDKTFRFHLRRDVEVLPQWLDYALKSLVLRDQIERGASGTSPTMKNISKEKVLELLLPSHSPAEQHLIVDQLNELQAKVDTLKQLQAAAAIELDALMPSILDRAFRGELLSKPASSAVPA